MENFIFSLNATAPIFLVMILGNILMKTGFFLKNLQEYQTNLYLR